MDKQIYIDELRHLVDSDPIVADLPIAMKDGKPFSLRDALNEIEQGTALGEEILKNRMDLAHQALGLPDNKS